MRIDPRAAFLLLAAACSTSAIEPDDPGSALRLGQGPSALHYTLHTELDLDRFSQPDLHGVLEVRYQETLFTDGEAVSFHRELDPELVPEQVALGEVVPMGRQAFSLIDGELREATMPPAAVFTPGDATYEVGPASAGHYELVDWQRAVAELGAGYGLAERVVMAESVPGDQGTTELGQLRMGRTDEARYRATYDDEGVLRDAEISLVQGPVIRRLRVQTSGTAYVQGRPFAAHGEAQLDFVSLVSEAEVAIDRWSMDFEDFEPLDRATFAARATVRPMEAPAGRSADDGDDVPPTDDTTSDSDSGDSAVDKCVDCKEEWVTTQDLLGASECEHGPEHDNSAACQAAKAAGAQPLCVEAGGACECFTCRGIPQTNPFSITCEGEIQEYMAWCELGNPNLTCATKPGANGITKKLIKQNSTGGVCNGSHGTMVQATLCGDPEGDGGNVTGACLATNCVSTGQVIGVQNGQRNACK